ncbi:MULTISPECIES: curli assembly protein CsgF [unclassified Cobetia]|uniref:curli assembly protein CsgF n=1 Tax=unclassified Cobetia TaxID=2609414 RepID=UPI00178C8A40|nr:MULTISPECIES: curli assembly protein CsgF [unclassified Cobetia]MBE2169424.1 curli production assembly/transport protein CsgF [Cobetia sp. 2AS1]MDH2448231.1 curli assembly protein CsgF [Cobetia sp. 2AS]
MKHQTLAVSLLLSAMPLHAGELIYQPINPSFGGNPLNGSYLLGKAQAQDTHEDPDAYSFDSLSETELFISDLRNSLVSDAITDAVDSTEPGRSSVIDSAQLRVEVISNGNGGFSMQVLDRATGETTVINLGTSGNTF